MLNRTAYETIIQRRDHDEGRSGDGHSRAAAAAGFDYVEIWAAKLRKFLQENSPARI